jgi:hypothetical protein
LLVASCLSSNAFWSRYEDEEARRLPVYFSPSKLINLGKSDTAALCVDAIEGNKNLTPANIKIQDLTVVSHVSGIPET